MSVLDVRERYSLEGVRSVSGRSSDEGELDGDERTDDDGGKYYIGGETDEDDSLRKPGSVLGSSVSSGSDSIRL